MAVEDCLPENIKQNKVTFVCLFVAAAPTLFIDKTRLKTSQHALLVTHCDRLTANHTLGLSSPKELFSPVSGGRGAGICGARLGRRGQKSISRLFKVALKREKIKQNFIEYRRAYHALLRIMHTVHLAFNSFSY